MLLQDRTVLVTGVLTPSSIAHTCARVAQEEGATVVLTSFGRAMSTTRRAARKLPVEPEVLELDVADQTHLDALAPQIADRWGELHGVVHAVGFAPAACLGQDDGLFAASWEDVATALQVSAWSLPAIAKAVRPVLGRGGSIVGLDFDASVAWPAYDWMGVAKAALESASRYLARDLGPDGVRVNLVAAGPLRTVAARSIPGFHQIDEVWQQATEGRTAHRPPVHEQDVGTASGAAVRDLTGTDVEPAFGRLPEQLGRIGVGHRHHSLLRSGRCSQQHL